MAGAGGEEKEMVNGRPKVAIVGYGKVGKFLLEALPKAGWQVTVVVTRQQGVQIAGCATLGSVHELPADIGIAILALRDKDIAGAVSNLSSVTTSPGRILAHTAGAFSAEILGGAREKGWKVMAWHPMQTFTGDDNPALLKGVTFGIDGDPEAVKVGEALARDLGGVPFRVPQDLRREYHLGAVIACNLLTGLVAEACVVLQRAGMSEERALEAVTPLMQATIENIAHKGIAASISGPLVRGDLETIKQHFEVLHALPDAEKLYRMLSLVLLDRLEKTDARTDLKRVLSNK